MEYVIFHLPVLCHLIQFFKWLGVPSFYFYLCPIFGILFRHRCQEQLPLGTAAARPPPPPCQYLSEIGTKIQRWGSAPMRTIISKMDNWTLYWLDGRAFWCIDRNHYSPI
jgi:hypothetical protein